MFGDTVKKSKDTFSLYMATIFSGDINFAINFQNQAQKAGRKAVSVVIMFDAVVRMRLPMLCQ